MELELGCHSRMDCLAADSPGEVNGREVELGPNSWMDYNCLAAELFLNSRFWDTDFVTLFISDVHKLLRTGGVPTAVTLLFWPSLMASSVFTGRSIGMIRSPPFPIPNEPFGFRGRKATGKKEKWGGEWGVKSSRKLNSGGSRK